jgi:hypothetical protein
MSSSDGENRRWRWSSARGGDGGHRRWRWSAALLRGMVRWWWGERDFGGNSFGGRGKWRVGEAYMQRKFQFFLKNSKWPAM